MQLFNRRLLTVFFLGFSSGLPLALVGATLQAWFTVSGVGLTAIGLLSLVGQPYVYKFFWAPLMDRYVPPLLGRRRGWILLMQCGLIVGLAVMAWLEPSRHAGMIALLAFAIAFLSASQDIAIDAYRSDVLKPEERGLGAALGVAGYRVAMIVSGGLALVLADYFGWQITYLCMAALMLIGVLASLLGPETGNLAHPRTLAQAVVEPFREFMQRPAAVSFLLFILLYRLGDSLTTTTGSLTTAFLLRELGFSLTIVGTINKGIGVFATMLGLFIAGMLMTRIRLYTALLAFGALQAVTNLSFMLLAMAGKNLSLMTTVIFLDNLCAGMGMTALVALMMSLCDRRYTATQFALMSAIMAVPRVYAGAVTGFVIEHLGWTEFFFWTFMLALPGLFLLIWLRGAIDGVMASEYSRSQ